MLILIQADNPDYFANEIVVSGTAGGSIKTNILLNSKNPIASESTILPAYSISVGTDLVPLLNMSPIYFDRNSS